MAPGGGVQNQSLRAGEASRSSQSEGWWRCPESNRGPKMKTLNFYNHSLFKVFIGRIKANKSATAYPGWLSAFKPPEAE